MKNCEICENKKKDGYFETIRLKIGDRMGSQVGVPLIEPIDLEICNSCRENRKKDILSKFKNQISEEMKNL